MAVLFCAGQRDNLGKGGDGAGLHEVLLLLVLISAIQLTSQSLSVTQDAYQTRSYGGQNRYDSIQLEVKIISVQFFTTRLVWPHREDSKLGVAIAGEIG